jgi:hypothetical protein
MTLNEKFKEVLINPIWQMTMIDKQMEIADEFAIGFAEWVLKNYDGVKSVTELLEIYKKEKGL